LSSIVEVKLDTYSRSFQRVVVLLFLSLSLSLCVYHPRKVVQEETGNSNVKDSIAYIGNSQTPDSIPILLRVPPLISL
jgi:hypothetical protein